MASPVAIPRQLIGWQVSAKDSLSHIHRSMQSEEKYIRAGLCNSQMASAVEAGIGQSFDPRGVDTPDKVYSLAKWPGKESVHAHDRRRLRERMDYDYSDVSSAPADNITTW